MSTLMTRYREAAHVARLREMRTKTLYELTNEFLAADNADDFVRIACEYITRVCGAAAYYVPGEESRQDISICIALPVMVRAALAPVGSAVRLYTVSQASVVSIVQLVLDERLNVPPAPAR